MNALEFSNPFIWIIFIVNLEIGYLTPPVGLNLFVASALYEKGLGHVIRSVAPFVGLFGTVWGIMNAFIEIAEQQNTNLAVVAPGIAEALLATGLGLLAAIPAVIFYNKLSSDADRIVASYEAFADEFATILSRQLDS